MSKKKESEGGSYGGPTDTVPPAPKTTRLPWYKRLRVEIDPIGKWQIFPRIQLGEFFSFEFLILHISCWR